MKHRVGTVKQIWRYPVKSMAGEVLSNGLVTRHGIVGDRYWSLRDEANQENLTVRKAPQLLRCSARFIAEPEAHQIDEAIPGVEITLPDDTGLLSEDRSQVNDALSTFLNKPVGLYPLQPASKLGFYRLKKPNGEKALKKQFNVASISDELPSMSSFSWLKILELSMFATPVGRFYDAYPLHILTSNSLNYLRELAPEGDFRVERFRPNLLIESAQGQANLDEFAWLGGTLHIGEVRIRCESRTVRCSMPAQPQLGLERDNQVVKTMVQHTERHLGINATVKTPGTISEGDEVFWEPPSKLAIRKLYQPISDPLKHHFVKGTLKLIDRVFK